MDDGDEQTITISSITMLPELQIRALQQRGTALTLLETKVDEYQTLLAEGLDMGRLVVVAELDTTGTPTGRLLLADGFHRLAALKRLERTEVDIVVYVGTFADAVMLACEGNANRGLHYSTADKRKVAEAYLEALDLSGRNWSDAEIARRLGISRSTIARARADRDERTGSPAARTVTRNGTTYTMEVRRSTSSQTFAPSIVDHNLIDDDEPVSHTQTQPPAKPTQALKPGHPTTPSVTASAVGQKEVRMDPSTIQVDVIWAAVNTKGALEMGKASLANPQDLPPIVRTFLIDTLKELARKRDQARIG